MTPPLTMPAETGRPVLTQGEGNRTTAHLNLTRSLADVPSRKARNQFGHKRTYERQKWGTGRIPFAGKDDE